MWVGAQGGPSPAGSGPGEGQGAHGPSKELGVQDLDVWNPGSLRASSTSVHWVGALPHRPLGSEARCSPRGKTGDGATSHLYQGSPTETCQSSWPWPRSVGSHSWAARQGESTPTLREGGGAAQPAHGQRGEPRPVEGLLFGDNPILGPNVRVLAQSWGSLREVAPSWSNQRGWCTCPVGGAEAALGPAWGVMS